MYLEYIYIYISIYADICSLFNVSVKELWDVVHAKLFAEDGRPSISAELKLQREFGWINRCFESVQVTCDSCFLAPYSSCWARIESGGGIPFPAWTKLYKSFTVFSSLCDMRSAAHVSICERLVSSTGQGVAIVRRFCLQHS